MSGLSIFTVKPVVGCGFGAVLFFSIASINGNDFWGVVQKMSFEDGVHWILFLFFTNRPRFVWPGTLAHSAKYRVWAVSGVRTTSLSQFVYPKYTMFYTQFWLTRPKKNFKFIMGHAILQQKLPYFLSGIWPRTSNNYIIIMNSEYSLDLLQFVYLAVKC